MRCWFCILPLIVLAACSTTKELTITARPSDAVITVDDGAQRGTGRLTATVVFKGASDLHKVSASRAGYQDKTLTLRRDDPSANISIELDPFKRRLSFSIVPVPGVVTVDGSALSTDPVSQISTVQPFTQDGQGNWTKYTITVTREGWDPTTRVVSWTDPSSDYILQLQPKHKDVTIKTEPAGATVTIDDETIGQGPATKQALTFPYDNSSGQYQVRKVRIAKPGYDAVEKTISWDDGKTDYDFALIPHEKTVHFITDPAGASVTIDGKPATPGPDGLPAADLTFVPTDDKGTLPVYTATVTKKGPETEWYPTTMPVAWEEGRQEYSATLKEITTRHVPELSIGLERDSDGVWQVSRHDADTIGMKDVSEGPGREPPTQVYQAPKEVSIGTLAASPANGQILFTILSGNTKLLMRSQIMSIDTTAGAGVVQEITDGKALDIMPSFNMSNEDGQVTTQVVFSSNRSGRRLNIWRRPLNGGFPEQLTSGEEQDLWPMIDVSPKPRVFYEVLSDSQPDPQLYMSPLGGASRTNLTNIPIDEPRISPLADAILFTSRNQRTGNREIYRIPARGGMPTNLTNDPDSDCYDPAWSKDGSMVAYVSDRSLASFPVMTNGQVVEERHHNADIWIIDLNKPDKPLEVTTNASIDDCPAWDSSGTALYFRSNRGGRWGIWKIAVK